MNVIVNVDQNWAIGKENQLAFPLKKDLQFFKEKTTNQVIVLGRKTLSTFPKGEPLPNRTNIILSRNPNLLPANCIGVSSMEELFEELVKYPSDSIWITGGGQIYKELTPYCETAYVTKVQDQIQNADAFFPDLDANPHWNCIQKSEIFTENTTAFQIWEYKNKKIQNFN